MTTKSVITIENEEKSEDMQTAIAKRERFDEPSEAEVLRAILVQMGYYLPGFTSMQFSPEQFRVVNEAVMEFPNWTLEELVVEGIKRLTT